MIEEIRQEENEAIEENKPMEKDYSLKDSKTGDKFDSDFVLKYIKRILDIIVSYSKQTLHITEDFIYELLSEFAAEGKLTTIFTQDINDVATYCYKVFYATLTDNEEKTLTEKIEKGQKELDLDKERAYINRHFKDKTIRETNYEEFPYQNRIAKAYKAAADYIENTPEEDIIKETERGIMRFKGNTISLNRKNEDTLLTKTHETFNTGNDNAQRLNIFEFKKEREDIKKQLETVKEAEEKEYQVNKPLAQKLVEAMDEVRTNYTRGQEPFINDLQYNEPTTDNITSTVDIATTIFPKAPCNNPETYEFVNHPTHYNNFSVECIDMMTRIYGTEKTADWCEMTAFKYAIRCGDKPGDAAQQDINKRNWYLNKAKELREKTNTEE